MGSREYNRLMTDAKREGVLFLVGTPIGNLEDITLRAIRVLKESDLVAAEDTRRARKLLSHLGIRVPLMSCHGHNERVRAEEVAELVAAGKKVALLSDAGMPGVSDPGHLVVEECVSRGLRVEVVPGPSSLTAALAVSGFPLSRFRFEGFLPRSAAARRSRLMELLRGGEPFVCFEAPHRILEALEDLSELAPHRKVVVARELTKAHEEVLRGRADEVIASLAGREMKGEFVVVVSGGEPEEPPALGEALKEVESLTGSGLSIREAVKAVSQARSLPQRDIYQAWLRLREGNEPGRKGRS